MKNWQAIDRIVKDAIARLTLDELRERLHAHQVGFSPIYDAADIFADPHFIARQAIVSVPDEELGEVRMQCVVPRFSETPVSVRRAGPSLGQHSDEVYGALGLGAEEIARLARRGNDLRAAFRREADTASRKKKTRRRNKGGCNMRRLLMAVTALVLAHSGARAAEITRILVGFPPGQATDMVARLLADRLSSALGETVIVENRPGQGGSMALAQLSQSPADGHTMVLAPLASLVVNPHMYKSVTYNTLKDFAPVALAADLPIVLVVNPSLPVKNVSELVAYAKANPDKLTHPSSGNGTLSHLGMEVFKQSAGITILHVPYRGSVPAMVDLMGGIVNVAMDTVAVTEPFIREGKMRLIASAYSKRIAAFPDTPTMAEQGYPGIGLSAWLGIVVSAATPQARVDRLGAEINKITQSPDIVEKFATLGALPRALGPKEFGEFLASEDARWGAVVKSSGVKIE